MLVFAASWMYLRESKKKQTARKIVKRALESTVVCYYQLQNWIPFCVLLIYVTFFPFSFFFFRSFLVVNFARIKLDIHRQALEHVFLKLNQKRSMLYAALYAKHIWEKFKKKYSAKSNTLVVYLDISQFLASPASRYKLFGINCSGVGFYVNYCVFEKNSNMYFDLQKRYL